MKNFKYPLLFIVLISVLYCSCSKTDDAIPATQTSSNTGSIVIKNSTTVATNGFNYKTFYQEVATANNRKGIVILAHGDGGSSNDVLLNDQCTALAQEGYVAITTSYRAPTFTGGSVDNDRFKADMESIVNAVTNLYAISVNKTLVGGLSRGGNLAFNMFLPSGQYGSPTTLNLKGAILECSGGDNYKGSNMLKQVAYMSNKTDSEVGADAIAFQTGLTTNSNNIVKTLSECYIVNSNGHCTNADEYKAFVVRKVKEWLP
jgi:predicted alpha/beta-fold hydrolase